MAGGQAGAPADDDHVPWSRPPGVATVLKMNSKRLVADKTDKWGKRGNIVTDLSGLCTVPCPSQCFAWGGAPASAVELTGGDRYRRSQSS
jgi:hypothetical protein